MTHQRVFPIRIRCSFSRKRSGHVRRDEVAILRTAQNIETARSPRRSGRELVLHVRAAGISFLGFDQYDTVGSARAVDRGGRCVLEDGDRLNVGWVDEVEWVARKRWIAADADTTWLDLITGDRHAVDDVKRFIAGADRSAAAHQNVRA